MKRALATRITTSLKTGQERRKQKKRRRLEVIRKGISEEIRTPKSKKKKKTR